MLDMVASGERGGGGAGGSAWLVELGGWVGWFLLGLGGGFLEWAFGSLWGGTLWRSLRAWEEEEECGLKEIGEGKEQEAMHGWMVVVGGGGGGERVSCFWE